MNVNKRRRETGEHKKEAGGKVGVLRVECALEHTHNRGERWVRTPSPSCSLNGVSVVSRYTGGTQTFFVVMIQYYFALTRHLVIGLLERNQREEVEEVQKALVMFLHTHLRVSHVPNAIGGGAGMCLQTRDMANTIQPTTIGIAAISRSKTSSISALVCGTHVTNTGWSGTRRMSQASVR